MSSVLEAGDIVTTTTDLAALQAAARLDTADHSVRLAIADWLEEQPTRYTQSRLACMKPLRSGVNMVTIGGAPKGTKIADCGECETCLGLATESILDTSDRDRAEAIRLGVRLKGPCESGMSDERHADVPCSSCDPLYARLRELIDRHGWEKCPCPECGGGGEVYDPRIRPTRAEACLTCGWTGDLFQRMRTDFHARTADEWGRDLAGSTDSRVTFDRGFLVVEASAGECWETKEEWSNEGNEYRAVTRPAPWLAALSRTPAWPWVVLRVRGKTPEPHLRSRMTRPDADRTVYSWFMQGLQNDPATLPEAIYDGLVGWDDVSDARKIWLSESAARDALGSALWTWADTHAKEDRT